MGGELININEPFILFSFHPVTTELQDLEKPEEVLGALEEIELPVITIWPC